jgi:hypothetical protein
LKKLGILFFTICPAFQLLTKFYLPDSDFLLSTENPIVGANVIYNFDAIKTQEHLYLNLKRNELYFVIYPKQQIMYWFLASILKQKEIM